MNKKIILIILLLCIVIFSSFPLDLRTLNGTNWFSWSPIRQVGYVQGALCEGFRITQMAILSNIIYDVNVLLKFRIDSDIIDIEICNEISSFYQVTERYDYPIYIVIYIRNSWKSIEYFPPWSESPWFVGEEIDNG